MKEKKQNEELQNRREFFKDAAKKALPIIGAIALASSPLIAQAAEKSEPPTGCDTCSYACGGSCASGCSRGCSGSCKSWCAIGCGGQTTANPCGSCSSACYGGCYGGCRGTCVGSCSSGCYGCLR
mgnify:CR=1 FL=1